MTESSELPRQIFRPSKPRASLSSLPSSSSTTTTLLNKENTTSTLSESGPSSATRSTRRKRAQSLGGEALDSTFTKRTRPIGELSPSKQARRGLVPRRSILKVTPAIFDGDSTTYDFISGTSGHTTDLSCLPSNRRASLRQAPTTAAQANQQDRDESDSNSDDGEMDMDITRMEDARNGREGAEDRRKSLARRVSFAPNAHIRTFTPDKPTAQAQHLQHQQLQQQQQDSPQSSSSSSSSFSSDPASESGTQDQELSETSMEMADDNVTRAFANHYQGTVPHSVYAQDAADAAAEAQELEEENSIDEDGTQAMEEVTEDITGAFANEPTAVRNAFAAAAVSTATSVKAKPRHSEVARQEDREDAEILRSLGMMKGRGVNGVVVPVVKNKVRGGVSFGGNLIDDDEDDESSEEMDAEGDTFDEGEKTMEMTTAIGSVLTNKGKGRQSIGLSAEVSDGSEDGSDEEDMNDEKTMDMDATMAMQDATMYGGIIAGDNGVPTPSTPSARLQAQLFARQAQSAAFASPVKVKVQPSLHQAPHNSPRRSILPTPASASKSPRKVLNLPSSTIATPNFKLANKAEPQPTLSTPKRSGSPFKSPFKAPTPKFVPKVLPGARSPGGSLSLKGLLQEQMAGSAYKAPSSLASPARKVNGWESPGNALKQEDLKEEDNTESSFGGYGEEEIPEAITSLEAFFLATGTLFIKDNQMAGVDLRHRRKSFAPRHLGREASGPPTFADLAVAGGCKSLFHQLYQSDSARLQEEIYGTSASLAQCDEALKYEQPRIFAEWTSATAAHKTTMQNQFRVIKEHYRLASKIEWNECRSSNHQSIIDVMEDNLEGLRADNAVVSQTNFEDVLPSLKARQAALLAELHEERTRDVELNACDQSVLAELHEGIAEQARALETQQSAYSELASQLAQFQAQEQELGTKLARIQTEKAGLQRMLEEGRCFTKAEVLRLKAEYEALQFIHGWELLEFSNMDVKLRHLDQFTVVLKLGSRGEVRAASFSLAPIKDQLEADVTGFIFNKVVENIQWTLEHPSTEGKSRHARSIINRISSLWTGARRLRSEILTTHQRFPVTVAPDSSIEALILSAEVHVPSAKTTFEVLFELTGEELVEGEEDRREARGSGSVVMGIGCDVVSRFGDADCEGLKYAIRERLDGGGPDAMSEAVFESELLTGARV